MALVPAEAVAKTHLVICNETSDTLAIVFAVDRGFSGWSSTGWERLEPNTCADTVNSPQGTFRVGVYTDIGGALRAPLRLDEEGQSINSGDVGTVYFDPKRFCTSKYTGEDTTQEPAARRFGDNEDQLARDCSTGPESDHTELQYLFILRHNSKLTYTFK